MRVRLFTNADLVGADVSALCDGADFAGTDLTGADLSNAVLTNTSFLGAELGGVDLSGTDMTGMNVTDVTFSTNPIFSDTTICPDGDASIADADGNYPFCIIQQQMSAGRGCFAGIDLTNAVFSDATLINVNFNGAILDGAYLSPRSSTTVTSAT